MRERGWVHHIPRLMLLGNHALQRGYSPPSSPTGSPRRSSTASRGSCRRTSSG
ncbi:hypothetical protein ACFQV2_25350 [Actinokineospora soli]|uniref:Uncharacterized protein n=1 Tax=Actinokineospora soli TaxID=1048753 RepID=A0ABW2TR73_9PSEU